MKRTEGSVSSSLTNPLSRFIDHLSYLSIGLVGGLLVLSGNPLVTVGVISSFTIYSSQFSKPLLNSQESPTKSSSLSWIGTYF